MLILHNAGSLSTEGERGVMDSYIAAERKRELDCVTRQNEERRGDDRMEKKTSMAAGTGKYTVI